MKVRSLAYHRAWQSHYIARGLNALPHLPRFHDAVARSKVHDLATRNARAAAVLFRLFPQASPRRLQTLAASL